jgi:hypothetical protein
LVVLRIDPKTGKRTDVGIVTRPRAWDVAVSPDGKYAMYTFSEQFVSDLMLVDGFR